MSLLLKCHLHLIINIIPKICPTDKFADSIIHKICMSQSQLTNNEPNWYSDWAEESKRPHRMWFKFSSAFLLFQQIVFLQNRNYNQYYLINDVQIWRTGSWMSHCNASISSVWSWMAFWQTIILLNWRQQQQKSKKIALLLLVDDWVLEYYMTGLCAGTRWILM